MIEYYIVRHGQTQWNVEGRLQGHLDSPLTDEGIASAHRLKETLKHMTFDAVYSSPSRRAVKTAQIATALDNLVLDERLMEIQLGDWQGVRLQDIQVSYPEQYHAFFNDPTRFYKADAESFKDVLKRVHSFLTDANCEHFQQGKVKRILIMTHGVTLMVFVNLFLNQPLTKLWVEQNANLNGFRYDGTHYEKIK